MNVPLYVWYGDITPSVVCLGVYFKDSCVTLYCAFLSIHKTLLVYLIVFCCVLVTMCVWLAVFVLHVLYLGHSKITSFVCALFDSWTFPVAISPQFTGTFFLEVLSHIYGELAHNKIGVRKRRKSRVARMQERHAVSKINSAVSMKIARDATFRQRERGWRQSEERRSWDYVSGDRQAGMCPLWSLKSAYLQ